MLCLCVSQVLVSCDENVVGVDVGPMALNIRLDYGGQEQINDEVYIRSLVRVYPANRSAKNKKPVCEYVFTCKQNEVCDERVALDLSPGNYEVMVWSDFVKNDTDVPMYNAEDFSEVTLMGEHCWGDDLRAAFKGSATVMLNEVVVSDTLVVAMESPFARFELKADDFAEFVSRELSHLSEDDTLGDSLSPFRLEDYTVVCYYIGFVPCAYSLYTDKPVDSATGVKFFSSIEAVSETEALLADDYVFVNDKNSLVSVRVGVFDANNELVSLTGTIKVPLKRGEKSTIRGSFLSQKKTDGIIIDTGYNGNFNLIFK